METSFQTTETAELSQLDGSSQDQPHVASICILGSRVHLIGLREAVEAIESRIAQRRGRCRQIIVTGYHGLWEAHKDAELKRILNAADLWLPDGIAPVFVARCRGQKGVQRIPGAELMAAFFQQADAKRYRSFFYGDTEATLAALKGMLEKQYPGHQVVGTFSPPFRALSPEEDEQHIQMINDARPDVLWVGLGMPRQDRWIYERLDRLKVPVAIGVGAAFGFLSGQIARAPQWLGNCGLEWAYRLWKEPKKCWRRSLVEGPKFWTHVLLEVSGLRRYG